MARKVRHSSLESRSSRLRLVVRRKPYPGPKLARGVHLLYRRNQTNGSWVLKASAGDGGYWTQRIGEADDHDESNGKTILTFFEAQDAPKTLAGRGTKDDTTTAPVTVDRALSDFKNDLISRGADPYNAEHPRVHLTAQIIAKPVVLLTSKELKHWRDGLLEKIAPATINRLCNSLCAALELAAQHDPRIKNSDAWEVGLAGLPDAQTARNVVISDAKVHAFVAEAYAKDPATRSACRYAGSDRREADPSRAPAGRGFARSPVQAETDDAEVGQGWRAQSQSAKDRTLFGADHGHVVEAAEGGGGRTRA